MNEPLRDPVLSERGIEHGFGRRGSGAPEATVFARQVHGTAVLRAGPDERGSQARSADAVLATGPGQTVGVVTADCVPILVAAEDGRVVAAIHAGWRGLAAGVIEAGVRALLGAAPEASLVCAVGPAARGCCYEVDEPVRAALATRYMEEFPEVLVPGRAGHYQLDLPLLASRVLEKIGVDSTRIGVQNRLCTLCDAEHFESHRRDGEAAGRMRHFITRTRVIPRRG